MAGPGPQPILPGIGPGGRIKIPLPNFSNPPNFGLNPKAPGNQPGGATPAGGNDWQHLLVRIAEFMVGATLIAVGINALIVRSKTGQTVINIAGATAGGTAGKVARTATR
jgi:hypothetical protein